MTIILVRSFFFSFFDHMWWEKKDGKFPYLTLLVVVVVVVCWRGYGTERKKRSITFDHLLLLPLLCSHRFLFIYF